MAYEVVGDIEQDGRIPPLNIQVELALSLQESMFQDPCRKISPWTCRGFP